MPQKNSNPQDPKSLPKLSLAAQRQRLYNHLSAEDAQKKLLAETFKRQTISFYLYFQIDDISSIRVNDLEARRRHLLYNYRRSIDFFNE